MNREPDKMGRNRAHTGMSVQLEKSSSSQRRGSKARRSKHLGRKFGCEAKHLTVRDGSEKNLKIGDERVFPFHIREFG
jgi:hypothetical protein